MTGPLVVAPPTTSRCRATKAAVDTRTTTIRAIMRAVAGPGALPVPTKALQTGILKTAVLWFRVMSLGASILIVPLRVTFRRIWNRVKKTGVRIRTGR